jgi:hypothetical protein
MKVSLPRRCQLLPVSLAFLLVAAACGTGTASPTAPALTAADTAGPTSTSTVAATSTAAGTAAATGTAASATGAPTATGTVTTSGPLARGAWVHGQAIGYYALVGPGQGWVWADHGIWQTLDDGASWANATPGLGTSHALIVGKVKNIAAIDANHAALVVSDVQATATTVYIWRTADGGVSWSYVALPDFRRAATAAACGTDPQCVGDPGGPAATIDYVSTSVMYLSLYWALGVGDYVGGMQMQYRSVDGGQTWTRLHFTAANDMYAPEGMPTITFSSATTGVVTTDGGFAYGTHAGWGSWTSRQVFDPYGAQYWQELSAGLVDDTHWFLGSRIAAGTLTYATPGDQGGNWTLRTCTIPGVGATSRVHVKFLDQINWIATATYDGATVGANTYRTFMTGDAGANWTNMGLLPGHASETRWVNLVRGWALERWYDTYNVYATVDNGHTWHVITP